MKKVFLVLLAAGMFVACGNKAAQEETTDTVAVVEEVVEAEPVVVEEAPVAEETAAPAEETKTIKSAATKAAINAIEQGSEAATEATVKEIQTKSRR